MNFELTAKQIELRAAAASNARHILAYGGSRSGKTFGFSYCVAGRAIQSPESRHLICRLHNVDVRQAVLMDTWPSMMRLAWPGVKYEVNKQDQYVVLLHNEAEIWFGGLDDKERVEKILGKEYATIYANECSQLSYETISLLRTRLAQNAKKQNGAQLALKAYYDLNPTGRTHWTYKEFVECVRPQDGFPLPAGSRAWVQLNPTDNPFLPEGYLEELASLPERQRQRFLDGRYLSEVIGALWPLERLEACRVPKAPPLGRIVIGVDPSGSDGLGTSGDQQGIVVVGKGQHDNHAYLIEDASCRLSPAMWGHRVAALYRKYNADCVVAEANFGGAMVENTLKTANPNMVVKMVRASRGKHVRAEPVAALYETTAAAPVRAHHVGMFSDLEDQLASMTTDGYQGSGSPDRADALVWAMTELMLEETPTVRMFLRSIALGGSRAAAGK